MKMGYARLLLASAMAIATIASQADAQDVIMRRPLSHKPGTSDPSTTTPTPNPASPTPGASPSPSPTSTDHPCDPDVDADCTSGPSDLQFAYAWRAGPWQGSAVCGQTATLTRSLNCMRIPYTEDDSRGFDPMTNDPDLGQTPNSIVFQPRYQVDTSICDDNAWNDKPDTSITTSTGNCGYHISTTVDPWTNDDPQAAVFCSDGSYRKTTRTCLDSTGAATDMSNCESDVETGADPYTGSYDEVSYESGNYSQCSYSWHVEHDGGVCNTDPGHESELRAQYYDAVCVRDFDNTKSSDANCNAADKPLVTAGWKTVGTCVSGFPDLQSLSGTEQSCWPQDQITQQGTGSGNGPVQTNQAQLSTYTDWQSASDQCSAAGATCCVIWSRFYAQTGTVTTVMGFKPADGQSDLGLLYNYVGGSSHYSASFRKWYPDPSTPESVFEGEHYYSGGGGPIG